MRRKNPRDLRKPLPVFEAIERYLTEHPLLFVHLVLALAIMLVAVVVLSVFCVLR